MKINTVNVYRVFVNSRTRTIQSDSSITFKKIDIGNWWATRVLFFSKMNKVISIVIDEA